MAGMPTTKTECDGSGGSSDSRVIITSPEITDTKQAVNDHFQRSIECAMAALASTGGKTQVRPWPDRNLPDTFFSKPSKAKTLSNTSICHSRDGSTDSCGRYPLSPSGPPPLVQHARTHSLPAIVKDARESGFAPSYQQTNPSLIHHQKHRSFDNTLSVDNAASMWQQGACPDQPRYGEGTSRSLGDLATHHGGPQTGTCDRAVRKVSCGDDSALWNDANQGQNQQKASSHVFVRQHHPRHPSGVSGGVSRQIMKRQQQQQQQQQHYQQQHQQQQQPVNAPGVNPLVNALSQERQRMYERKLQLSQQGLLDTPSTDQGPSHGPQYMTDYQPGQYSSSSSQQFNPPAFPPRQGYVDSSGYDAYLCQPNNSEIDLNFGNISLDNITFMDVDPTTIPSGPLDIAPNDLDQYLN